MIMMIYDDLNNVHPCPTILSTLVLNNMNCGCFESCLIIFFPGFMDGFAWLPRPQWSQPWGFREPGCAERNGFHGTPKLRNSCPRCVFSLMFTFCRGNYCSRRGDTVHGQPIFSGWRFPDLRSMKSVQRVFMMYHGNHQWGFCRSGYSPRPSWL